MFRALRRCIPILAITALIAGCGTSSSGSSTIATNPTPPPGAVHVSLLDYSISPAKISVPAGAFTLYVTNDGKTPHNFTIRTRRAPGRINWPAARAR